MKTTYDRIFLADNEWGSPLMCEVAQEYFAHHPDVNFVMVYEHAGWSLSYHRTLEVVGSANDLAVFRKDCPRATGYSGHSIRREVQRPDLHEVTTLQQYTTPFPTAAAPLAPLALAA